LFSLFASIVALYRRLKPPVGVELGLDLFIPPFPLLAFYLQLGTGCLHARAMTYPLPTPFFPFNMWLRRFYKENLRFVCRCSPGRLFPFLFFVDCRRDWTQGFREQIFFLLLPDFTPSVGYLLPGTQHEQFEQEQRIFCLFSSSPV